MNPLLDDVIVCTFSPIGVVAPPPFVVLLAAINPTLNKLPPVAVQPVAEILYSTELYTIDDPSQQASEGFSSLCTFT